MTAPVTRVPLPSERQFIDEIKVKGRTKLSCPRCDGAVSLSANAAGEPVRGQMVLCTACRASLVVTKYRELEARAFDDGDSERDH